LLLSRLASSASTVVLGKVSCKNNGFKCGKNLADLYSVLEDRTERLGVPECVLGERVSAQSLKPLDELLCTFLDVNKERVMVGWKGPFDSFIVPPSRVDGIAQPGSRLFV